MTGRAIAYRIFFFTGLSLGSLTATAKANDAVELVLIECQAEISFIGGTRTKSKVFRGTVSSTEHPVAIDESFEIDGVVDQKFLLYVSYNGIGDRPQDWPYRQLAINLGFNEPGKGPSFSTTSNIFSHNRREVMVLSRPTYIASDLKGISVFCEVKPLVK